MAGDPVRRIRVLSGLTIMRALLTTGIKAILAVESAATAPPVSGFDQTHLAALIAGAKPPKPKVAKAATKTAWVVKTASADKTPPAEKAAARR